MLPSLTQETKALTSVVPLSLVNTPTLRHQSASGKCPLVITVRNPVAPTGSSRHPRPMRSADCSRGSPQSVRRAVLQQPTALCNRRIQRVCPVNAFWIINL